MMEAAERSFVWPTTMLPPLLLLRSTLPFAAWIRPPATLATRRDAAAQRREARRAAASLSSLPSSLSLPKALMRADATRATCRWPRDRRDRLDMHCTATVGQAVRLVMHTD